MIRAIDLFCGAGGCSSGAKRAGVRILAGFDMWDLARRTYEDNFPGARVYGGQIENISAKKVAREVGKVQLILASPECTSHSVAKGNGRRSEDSRMTAFEVVRFAKRLRSRWVVIENVMAMREWRRYGEFIGKLRKLGYKVREEILDAAEFGVPQSRKRLFILCDRKRGPLPIRRPKLRKPLPASTAISMNGASFSNLLRRGLARKTLARARRAMKVVGRNKPFLLVYYGSDGAGGWQRLNAPLRTVTTLDRFALVRPSKQGHKIRMLQVPELRTAMGFRAGFKLRYGTRRDQIHLLGNAVCPPVMKAVVRSLTKV